MNHDDVVRVVFVERYRAIKRHGPTDETYEGSIVSDLIDTINFFSLSTEVDNMVERNHFYQKGHWRKMVWERAWSLEDVFWKIEYRLRRSLDLISSVNYGPRYLTLWALSDKYPEHINMCETMSRFVCHASLLKMDDLRLKKLTMYYECCPLCELSAPDDVEHLVLQCPSTEQKRRDMFYDIDQCFRSLGARTFENAEDILPILLGKCRVGYSFEQMEELWIIAGKYIHGMYRENLTLKRGIG